MSSLENGEEGKWLYNRKILKNTKHVLLWLPLSSLKSISARMARSVMLIRPLWQTELRLSYIVGFKIFKFISVRKMHADIPGIVLLPFFFSVKNLWWSSRSNFYLRERIEAHRAHVDGSCVRIRPPKHSCFALSISYQSVSRSPHPCLHIFYTIIIFRVKIERFFRLFYHCRRCFHCVWMIAFSDMFHLSNVLYTSCWVLASSSLMLFLLLMLQPHHECCGALACSSAQAVWLGEESSRGRSAEPASTAGVGRAKEN